MGFMEELVESGYIHRPLPIHPELSMEQRLKEKSVLKRKTLWENGTGRTPCLLEQGNMYITEGESREGKLLAVKAPLECDCWPKTMPQDGDCAYYGRIRLAFPTAGENWKEYDRLRFQIKPECEGVRVVTLSLYLINDGEQKVPDKYRREGFHMCICENRQWNDCIWEFPSLPRDRVVEFGFQYRLSGRDTSCGQDAAFFIASCCLERSEQSDKEEGWDLPSGGLAGNMAGFGEREEKRMLVDPKETEFWVEDEWGSKILHGDVKKQVWQEKEYGIADLTELGKGRYRFHAGTRQGEWFPVDEDIWEEVIYKGINFLFCERCGYPVPGKHGLCHMDVYAEHNGLKLPYCGGWHDAGDMSQQTAQTAETTEALFELAGAVKGRTGLYQRVLEEALWGLEFVLRTRFGDGYRATSLGLIRYTDGKIGNEDDASNVRVHNYAMENIICAGVEALAGEMLAEDDPELSWRCIQVAKEDFSFGIKRFEEFGLELPIRWEHTYDSSLTLMYAEICLAASRIFGLTGEAYYGEMAARYGTLLTECQETETDKTGVTGYFYRDERKEKLLHYCHQSREHVPMAALRKLCQTQNCHPQRSCWEQAIEQYGRYIKSMDAYSSPYGMLPAGIYSLDEAEDRETFELHHIQANYEEEKENYIEQVKQGTLLKGNYYVRQFPVWFSFRGNGAHMLSMAKAAGIAGSYLEDRELLRIATRQKDWNLGMNPFGRPLMYGMGKGYEPLYSVFPGICVGQLPVGVQTKGNSDIPHWPMANNSTYKEVWVSSLSKLLGVVAEIYQNQN